MSLIHRGAELENFSDYLSDESRMSGNPEGVALPENKAELEQIIADCLEKGENITVSSGLTGITGGGVARDGVALSLKKLNRITGLRQEGENWFVSVEAGVVLGDLRDCLHKKEFPGSVDWSDESKGALASFKDAGPLVFPVDPTEWSACIGGMVACNASGARSYHYGAMRCYVEGLKGFLADGRGFSLKRGENLCGENREFSLSLTNGEKISGKLPSYEMPKVKNAAGYFAAGKADLVDLFVGSEGTLAIIHEIELRLVREPESILGLVCFASSEESALKLVHEFRGEGDTKFPKKPLALEYFDHLALDVLRAHREESVGGGEIPKMPESFHTAVYVEFAGNEEECEECAIISAELLESIGCSEDAAWMATEPKEHEKLKTFRHAIPETVNLRVGHIRRECPTITKLGTDMAVTDDHLDDILSFYREKLADTGLDYIIFGHIGNNHVHVNIIPKNEEEYKRGKEIYIEFAKKAISFGGTVSAEHGLGKLKTFLLPVMYGESGVEEMRNVKRIFDSAGRLNPGTLFDL